jgi:hypothetical protein
VFDQVTSGQRNGQILGVVVAFLFYLVQYFVIFFANTALVGAAMIRLQGGDATVGDGFRIAAQRVGPIFGYALISATVGMILRAIANRGGVAGQIAALLFGLAWNLATYLVVPVLVVENVGPIRAVERSAALLKRTWGEQIVGNLGIGAVFGLLTFAVLIVGVPLIGLAAAAKSIVLVAGAIVLVVLALALLGLVGGALSGIYQAAVYRYAATGRTDSGFRPELVQGAFRPKRASSINW